MDVEWKFKIFVVDDEKANLIMLNKILSPKYSVFTARTGEEVFDRVKDIQPDLILLDIMLPGISGFDVLHQLKETSETRSIPVIIISGLTSEVDEEKGLLMGAVDYIFKPFKTAIILARVNTQLQIVNQIRMIERIGMVDALTDIPNRRCFDDRISIEWRRSLRTGNPLSLLMIDVDKFKIYNDTWGHPQGDTLLKALSRIFASAARRPGDLAARIGGEEFSLLLPDANLEAAVCVAEDIRAQVEHLTIPIADGITGTKITVSIGVGSCTPEKEIQIAQFISETDKKLYKAKELGRNRVCDSL
jgi:diguanylate cyclase (GGDEF)-like protein